MDIKDIIELDVDALIQHIIEERVGILTRNNLVDWRATLLVSYGVTRKCRLHTKAIRTLHRIALHSRSEGVAQSRRSSASSQLSSLAVSRVGQRSCDRCQRVAPLRLRQSLIREGSRLCRAKHNVSHRQGDNQQNEIFQSKMFQKFQNFSYLCRQVGKNA